MDGTSTDINKRMEAIIKDLPNCKDAKIVIVGVSTVDLGNLDHNFFIYRWKNVFRG